MLSSTKRNTDQHGKATHSNFNFSLDDLEKFIGL